MPEKSYIPRIVDEQLDFKLKTKGAVLIEGPKWCGKTTTAEQVAKSQVKLGDAGDQNQDLEFVKINTKKALEGETPRLFDEWQLVPALWDAIRYEVDHRNDFGQFILTGSAVPGDVSQLLHTGTGRFSWLKMRPMTLFESGDSNGKISLKELFDHPSEISVTCDMDLDKLAFVTCRGGWPRAIGLDGMYALAQGEDYYDAIIESDISRVDNVKRSQDIASDLLRSYARNQGSQTSMEEIRNDIARNSNVPSIETIYSYTEALKKIFVIEDIPAWNPNLRSKTAIRTSDTHYFVDPSIATNALHTNPDGLISDLNTFGFIFETLVMRDLSVYAGPLNGKVYHYRDKGGLECDAVVHLKDGRYGLIEIKLGADKDSINGGAERLSTLASKIDLDKMPAPAFKAVIVGNGQYAYLRPEDDTYIIPIGCLKD